MKKYVATRSRIVASPRYRAKPRTGPEVSQYRTAAAISDAQSALTIVEYATGKARSTAERNVRPERTSSLRCSK